MCNFEEGGEHNGHTLHQDLSVAVSGVNKHELQWMDNHV